MSILLYTIIGISLVTKMLPWQPEELQELVLYWHIFIAGLVLQHSKIFGIIQIIVGMVTMKYMYFYRILMNLCNN